MKHSASSLRNCRKKCPEVLAEADLRLHRGRLCFKLLVFRNNRDLRRCCKRLIGGAFCRQTLGFVHPLSALTQRIGKNGDVISRRIVAKHPRYFCVLGLLRQHLSVEVIAHEATHVAFAYTKRVKLTSWLVHAACHDEEAIAYPAGLAAERITSWLYDHGYLEAQPKAKRG